MVLMKRVLESANNVRFASVLSCGQRHVRVYTQLVVLESSGHVLAKIRGSPLLTGLEAGT